MEVSGNQLGKLAGIDRRRIYEKTNRGELQRNKNGLYDLEDSLWSLGISKNQMENFKEDHGRINISRLRALKERETAYLKRLERAAFEASLIEVHEIRESIFPYLKEIKSRLLSLPSRLAHLLASESNGSLCKDILDLEIRRVLSEISHVMEISQETP